MIKYKEPEPEPELVEDDSEESQPNAMEEYYESGIKDSLDDLKFIGEENKVFQGIREKHQDNWKIVELCRELLFENAWLSDRIRKGIENDRKKLKEFNRL